MVNNNNNLIIPKENIAKVEEVRYFDYKENLTEEQIDELVKASYDSEIDSYGDLGVEKGYGPCSSCSGDKNELKFELRIRLENCVGSFAARTVYNTNDAESEANKIKAESGFWSDGFLNYFSQGDRRRLASKIDDEIQRHVSGNGRAIDTSVCNKEPMRQSDLDRASSITDDIDLLTDVLSQYSGPEPRGSGSYSSFFFDD